MVRRLGRISTVSSLDLGFGSLTFSYSEHASFLDATYATYLISGELRLPCLDSVRDEDEMAVDEGEMDDSSEHIPETKITVVGETGP